MKKALITVATVCGIASAFALMALTTNEPERSPPIHAFR